MKTALFLVCLLCASAAFGQTAAGVLSAQPQICEFSSHPEHASQRPMAQAQNLLEDAGTVYEQGERPLWEAAPKTTPVPLGDSARALRKEHETAKKAYIIWEN